MVIKIEIERDDECLEEILTKIVKDIVAGKVFNNLKSNLPNSYVTVDQICLLHFDVLKFIQNIAKNEAVDLHRVGSTENESVVSVSETPEQFIFRLRLSGEQNEVIAVHLHNKFSSLNGYTKMKLINPEKVNHWEQQRVKIGRIRQTFDQGMRSTMQPTAAKLVLENFAF